MGRVLSTPASSGHLLTHNPPLAGWQTSVDDQTNAYAVFSDSAMLSRQPSLQPIAESFATDAMVEYSPAEFIDLIQSDHSSHALPQPYNSHQMNVQLTANAQWAMDVSTSPSTPSTALMTPITQASNSMSRSSSFNPQSVDDVSMLRVQSDSSSLYPIFPEDGAISFSSDVVSKSISPDADNLPFFTGFTGFSSETFLSPTVPVSSASVSALASSENKLCLVEDMRRSASASSDSSTGHASSFSSGSRQARRDREIKQAGRCRIAPKADPSTGETKTASSNAQMMRVRSGDGSSKNVGVIPKTPYVRPQHPKIECPHCNERREGFRGTHELERHIQRQHSVVRKGYICVAPDFDKNFLSGCKHCRGRKIYGAYYNAAAHLRRAHFHPRKRGRKGKNDEKRGGIGGGDDPPMDYLKQHWIREVEVENKQAVQPTPDSPSDSADLEADLSSTSNNFEASYDNRLPYAAVPQRPNDTSMLIDGRFIDFNLCGSNEPGSLYQSTMLYTAPNAQPVGDMSMNDFEFDAYRT